MVHSQNVKKGIVINPQSIGTSAVSGYVDTLGFDYVTIDYVGASVAAGGKPAALKIGHGDTTSAFTDISGGVGGTDFTIPTPNTSTGDVVTFFIDKNKGPIKRYVSLSTTGTATARIAGGVAHLSRAKETPYNDATANTTRVII